VLDIANGSSFENDATGPARTPDGKSPKRIHD
jgi:hypothetical protein